MLEPCPGNVPWMSPGRTRFASRSTSFVASPSAVPGLQVEADCYRRQLAQVIDRQRADRGHQLRDGIERNQFAAAGTDV